MSNSPYVLVVDDEIDLREAITGVLRAKGFEVAGVGTGADAVAAVAGRHPDAAIIDLKLEDMPGLRVLRHIRRSSPETECIVLTGHASQESAIEAVNAGAFYFLLKPCAAEQVVIAIRRAVEKTQRETSLREKHRALEQALVELEATQRQVIRQERLNALGEVVSGVAHDFNNVLMPVMGLADVLLSEEGALDDKEDVRSSLVTIRDAAREAREIIRGLHEFYRPGETLTRVPVNLHETVEAALTLTRPAWQSQSEARSKTVQVANRVPELPRVLGNESRLRQVFSNLILNAVTAIPEVGQITVSGWLDGDAIAVAVTDTGVGMPEEVKARCLEPLFSTRDGHGTGMGLAVCYGIVQCHGGDISIDSDVGRGTTVTVRLPRGGVRRPPGTRTQLLRTATPPGLSQERRALVVDDEIWARDLLTRYLTGQGFTVEAVASGEEAMFRLKSGSFCLAVVDRAMPGASGDEIARQIRRVSPPTRILMVTGFGEFMKSKNEVPDGVDEVVGKPVTAAELADAVARVLSLPTPSPGPTTGNPVVAAT